MKAPRILSVGEVLWDLFPEGPRFGGAPANFACHAAVLGGEVTMVSAVGDDARGAEAVEILCGYGVDVSLIQVVPGSETGSVGVELDENGKPTFTIHKDTAWDRLSWTDSLQDRLGDTDMVYFGTLGQRGEESKATIRTVLKAAISSGVPCLLDVNLRAPFFDRDMIRDSIAATDMLKLSDDELPTVCAACDITPGKNDEETLRRLSAFGKTQLVVMTRGAKGALLVSKDQTVDQPGLPTIVRDTVGAGDSFTARLALGLLRNEAYETILYEACRTAAAVCAQPGAVPIIHHATEENPDED